GLVGLALLQVLEERALGGGPGGGVDRLVAVVPVDREAEGAEDLLEGPLVQRGQLLAQLDEVATRDRQLVRRLRGLVGAALLRRREVRVVGQRGIAAHAVVVLGAALGGQAVVVPTQRVEHVLAAHALVAHDHVRLRVAEHVADVQRARGRGRRGVDAEDLVASGLGVEGVEVLLAPYAVPLLLQALEGGAVGDGGIRARCGIGHGGHCPRSAPACNAGGDSVSALAHRSRPDTSAARRPLSWTGAWQQQLAHTPPRAAMSPSATRPRRRAPARTAVPRPLPRTPHLPRPAPRGAAAPHGTRAVRSSVPNFVSTSSRARASSASVYVESTVS